MYENLTMSITYGIALSSAPSLYNLLNSKSGPNLVTPSKSKVLIPPTIAGLNIIGPSSHSRRACLALGALLVFLELCVVYCHS